MTTTLPTPKIKHAAFVKYAGVCVLSLMFENKFSQLCSANETNPGRDPAQKSLKIGPSRDFSFNLKQDLNNLSGFCKQLRSKSCFKISCLSGFLTVYLKKNAQKPREI